MRRKKRLIGKNQASRQPFYSLPGRAALHCWVRFALGVLLLVLLPFTGGIVPAIPGAQAGEDAPALEYRVKAAYLYNFIKFVDWPAENFPPAGEPIGICILGEDPFGSSLAPLTRKTVKNHALQITKIRSAGELKPCHILFISASERANLKKILQNIEKNHILTVGDMEGFSRAGGIIGFVIIDDRVRLEINLQAAEKNGLQISAKLLELATIVR